ncbi:hypothetical protein M434DRAFT_38693 [Hypoxylon sp. CO27-5]|nr:hypothetical protein M434DRAFT_38693 [Hypoxylon sp. CO27-5]
MAHETDQPVAISRRSGAALTPGYIFKWLVFNVMAGGVMIEDKFVQVIADFGQRIEYP